MDGTTDITEATNDATVGRIKTDGNSESVSCKNDGVASMLILLALSATVVFLVIFNLFRIASSRVDAPSVPVAVSPAAETNVPAEPTDDMTTSNEESERRRKEEEELRAQDEYTRQQNAAADLAATAGI